MTPAPGDPVQIRVSKWDGSPHWVHPGRYLGADRWGHWVGFPIGTHHARPGLAYDSEAPGVTLLPREDGWAATFYGPDFRISVYVDIATPATWDGPTVRHVDLDLDVIRLRDGSVVVDDEDEFAEHRVAFGYPPDVVAAAEDACARVRAALVAGTAPYDATTASGWLERLAELSPVTGRR